MTKNFAMTDSQTITLLFVENGITEDVAEITREVVNAGSVVTQSGITYKLTKDDYRRIIIEQIMYLMRSEKYEPMYDIFLQTIG